jgi:hypothetical protein
MGFHLRRTLRLAVGVVAVPALVAVAAAPAGACGGLVGENGTIQLTKTTTLAAYHDGVERYVTSFDFTGQGKEVGSIVPLPGVPSDVRRGGSWTLQRLEREVNPPKREFFALDNAAKASSSGAAVIQEYQVDALDIKILKGGGDEVGKWAVDHGFLLTPDAPAMLDFYGTRSQIFMTARFDARRAQQLGQNSGDGTPIMVTIPTRDPWVPLRILGLGLEQTKVVDADVFLLTDEKPKLLAGGPGLSLKRDEPASLSLLNDLRSDKNMEWVPEHMWFTYLPLKAEAGQLDYDLAVSTRAKDIPRLVDTGVSAPQTHSVTPVPSGRAIWPIAAAVAVALVLFAALEVLGRRRSKPGGAA